MTTGDRPRTTKRAEQETADTRDTAGDRVAVVDKEAVGVNDSESNEVVVSSVGVVVVESDEKKRHTRRRHP